MRRLGTGTQLVPNKKGVAPVGHNPVGRVTGGPAQPSVRKPITTKPLVVTKPTGGVSVPRTAIPRTSTVAPTGTAGAQSGVGRLAQNEYQKHRVRNSKLMR